MHAVSPTAPPCPICSATVESISHSPRFSSHRCRSCRHRFVTPARQALYGAGYDGYRDDPVFRAWVGRFLDTRLRTLSPPPKQVLDVGCGNGVFLEIAREHGYSVRGLDAYEAATEICERKNIPTVTGQFLELPTAELGTPDVITFWDVMEHLPSPLEYLRRAAEILAPDGVLIVKVPRTGDLSFRVGTAVPRLAGAVLAVPSHVQFFTEPSMAEALARAGFGRSELMVQGAIRGAPTGGSVRRRATRKITRCIRRASGDANLLVLARKGAAH